MTRQGIPEIEPASTPKITSGKNDIDTRLGEEFDNIVATLKLYSDMHACRLY